MTIKDIAARCGVSVSTVSRVLNGHPDVSETVRERVLRTVAETHYVPNSSARDLGGAQSDAVGLVIRGIDNSFFNELIHPIEQELLDAGYTPVLHQIRSGDDELEAAAQLARAKRLKGLILMGGSFDYTPERTARLGVPFVLCTYSNSFGTLNKEDYSSVTIDDCETGCRAARALISRGHRRIAFLSGSVNDRSISELRYRGYRAALEAAGIEPDPALTAECGEFDMDSAYRRMKQLLADGVAFSAVFAVSDDMAFAAIRALYEAGRRVPEDCSVIGVDGVTMARYSTPALTTFAQPKQALAHNAAQILLELIRGEGGNRQLLLKAELLPGESVRVL